ncbi:MAG: hypothetical protein IPM42_03155 [Saprospiraceae bacterium]|nr:hypothetical protein [Saprospiraceae bacterium]
MNKISIIKSDLNAKELLTKEQRENITDPVYSESDSVEDEKENEDSMDFPVKHGFPNRAEMHPKEFKRGVSDDMDSFSERNKKKEEKNENETD